MVEKKVNNWVLFVIIFGATVFVFFLINSWMGGFLPWPVGGRKFDAGATGELGDFVGGVIGTMINGITFYFIYLTLKEQRIAAADQRIANDKQSEAIEDQRQAIADQRQAIADQRLANQEQLKAYERERFEGRFFELVKWHRENTEAMSYQNPLDPGDQLAGAKVLQFIYQRIEGCFNEISPFFNAPNISVDNIYNDQALTDRRAALQVRQSLDLSVWAHCDIAYGGFSNNQFRRSDIETQQVIIPRKCLVPPSNGSILVRLGLP